jgi:hypothetical protein
MSWAAQRRFFIILIIGGVVTAFLMIMSISIFYKSPSCTDNTQNQDEEGIDCGGSCSYLCTAQEEPPTVLFTKLLTNSAGRTDIIASINNKNSGAASKNVPYRVKLYNVDHLLIQEVSGMLDLPPGATVPVFIPGVVPASKLPQGSSNKQTIASAFLSIDPTSLSWFSMAGNSRILPKVSNSILNGTTTRPRIEAILQNLTVTTLTNVKVIVLVHDSRGEIIAASSTVVPTILGQGQATATFTWNSPFLSTPSLIEIVPIIPLP